MKMIKNIKAYTLIELIITLALMSFLILIIIPNMLSFIRLANESVCLHNKQVFYRLMKLTEIQNQKSISESELNSILVENDLKCPDDGVYSYMDGKLHCSKHDLIKETPIEYLYYDWIHYST